MLDSNLTQKRFAFSNDDLATASPRRVLVKCFDRLDVDLEQALAALDDKDPETANRLLGHAQDLLGEVARMLDVDAWQPAGGLLAVYDYVLRLLAVGNMQKEPSLISEARTLLGEIGDAFRDASRSIEQSPAPTAPAPAAPAAPAAAPTPFGSTQLGDTPAPAAARPSFSALA